MTSNPAYEDVPTDISMSLTLEQAAARLGMKKLSFRTAMTELNSTDQGLRAPQQPGERSRKYDVDKLDAWKRDGMPTPKGPLRTPQARPGAWEVAAIATRNGAYWIVELPDINERARTESPRNANRLAHGLAVEKLGAAPDGGTVDLTITLPEDAAEKWADATTKEREAVVAAASAARLSREAIQDLRS